MPNADHFCVFTKMFPTFQKARRLLAFLELCPQIPGTLSAFPIIQHNSFSVLTFQPISFIFAFLLASLIADSSKMLSNIADLPAIKLNDTEELRFDLKDMTPFGREVAEQELRETNEVKAKAKEELRTLLKGKWYLTSSTFAIKNTHF